MPCLVAALAVLVLASPLYAQSQGFASVGRMIVGDDGPQLTASAGGEVVGPSGLFVGGEALVSFGRTGFRPGFPNGEPYRQYVLSALVGAQARSLGGFAPFVNGGLSLVTDPDCCGPGFGWNVGGGTNYWLTDRFGIRADLRLILALAGEGGSVMGRVGMVFR